VTPTSRSSASEAPPRSTWTSSGRRPSTRPRSTTSRSQ
jgi:hypothetical protein